MANYNKVILIGNLTRDPEVRFLSKGTAVAKFGLAVNRSWRSESGEQREEVTFVDIEAFGRQAETIGQYLRKGRPVMIEGRLRLDTWEDKQSGQKSNRMVVVVEQFQFLDSGGGRGGAEGEGGGNPREGGVPARSRSAAPPPPAESGGSSEAGADEAPADDDVPF